MARKKKNQELEAQVDGQVVDTAEEAVENAEKKDPMEGMTVEEQIMFLKKKLMRAKGEVVRAAGEKVERVIPDAPTNVEISSDFELDEETGNVIVTTMIDELVYKSYPKDGGKGIARTILIVDGEQNHEYNNIGIANVVAAFRDRFPDEGELEGIIYHALKSRKECIKSIDEELYVKAAEIRAAVKEAKAARREELRNEKIAAKEKQIAELEARIAELEASVN